MFIKKINRSLRNVGYSEQRKFAIKFLNPLVLLLGKQIT